MGGNETDENENNGSMREDFKRNRTIDRTIDTNYGLRPAIKTQSNQIGSIISRDESRIENVE